MIRWFLLHTYFTSHQWWRLCGSLFSWAPVHACNFLNVVQCAFIHMSMCPKGCTYAVTALCVCVWVTRAPASCCSACINTLLGLGKLSVNWGGKSLCAALFSHVTYPVCSGKQECKLWNLLTFTNKQRYIHTHTVKESTTSLLSVLWFILFCSDSVFLFLLLHFSIFHSLRILFPKWILPFLSSYSAGAISFTPLPLPFLSPPSSIHPSPSECSFSSSSLTSVA